MARHPLLEHIFRIEPRAAEAEPRTVVPVTVGSCRLTGKSLWTGPATLPAWLLAPSTLVAVTTTRSQLPSSATPSV